MHPAYRDDGWAGAGPGPAHRLPWMHSSGSSRRWLRSRAGRCVWLSFNRKRGQGKKRSASSRTSHSSHTNPSRLHGRASSRVNRDHLPCLVQTSLAGLEEACRQRATVAALDSFCRKREDERERERGERGEGGVASDGRGSPAGEVGLDLVVGGGSICSWIGTY